MVLPKQYLLEMLRIYSDNTPSVLCLKYCGVVIGVFKTSMDIYLRCEMKPFTRYAEC